MGETNRNQLYCFVGQAGDVLGVWTANNDVQATRLQLHLELTYPDCETVVDESMDFEHLKAVHSEYHFGGLKPTRADAA